MNLKQTKLQFKKLVLGVLILAVYNTSFAQKKDSTSYFKGSISVTNNGISLVPTFSLGKPAAIFNLAFGKGRLSFEPDMRFALEGKPWSFLFWWRYKLVQSKKLRFTVGAHPAMNFKSSTVILNGVSKNLIIVRRYLAGELSPNYLLSKNVSVGMYYLYSRGLDPDAPKHTHFLTLNSNFSNIKLPDQFFIKLTPQVYYLKQDKLDGFYCTVAITLAKEHFPFSLSAIVNKTIRTDIVSKNFVWNLNLIYSFNKTYVRHK
jgi:hypothetical protein